MKKGCAIVRGMLKGRKTMADAMPERAESTGAAPGTGALRCAVSPARRCFDLLARMSCLLSRLCRDILFHVKQRMDMFHVKHIRGPSCFCGSAFLVKKPVLLAYSNIFYYNTFSVCAQVFTKEALHLRCFYIIIVVIFPGFLRGGVRAPFALPLEEKTCRKRNRAARAGSLRF